MWEQYVRDAHRIADCITSRNSHWRRHAEDCRQVAEIALWKKSKKYDPSVGTTLIQFAAKRIEGAVWDELRRFGVINRHGRGYTHCSLEQEIAEGLTPASALADPHDTTARTDNRIAARELIAHYGSAPSPATARRVEGLNRYYFGGETLKEIGESWNVNESRAFHIVRGAEQAIRERVNPEMKAPRGLQWRVSA
jgi:RNA polymerase sigma factor (sigma-70 family)